MKNIFNKFMKMSLILSVSFFILVTFKSFFEVSKSKYLTQVLSCPYIIYWFFAILILLILFILNNVINNLSSKKRKIFMIVGIGMLILGQGLIVSIFNQVQITDPYLVNDQAISIAEGLESRVDVTTNSYFRNYSNNNFCFVISIYLVRFFKLIGLKNYNLGFTLFNVLMIDLSILFMYLFCKKLKGEKFATNIFVFNILNPLNYLLIHWTYTCTYSLAFMSLFLYLSILLKNAEKTNKKIVLSILLGMFFIIGFLMRPVIIIPFISIIICFIGLILHKRIDFKKYILSICIIFISMAISYFSLNFWMKKYINNGPTTFPVTHWIMMGLHGKGTVTSKDNSFTASFSTKEEKRNANIKEIISTLRKKRVSGLVMHTLVKVPITWSQGTADYNIRMNQDRNFNSAYFWIVSGKNDFLIVFCQSFRIITLLLATIYLISMLRKVQLNSEYMITLTMLGAFLFYLIWEAKSSYSVPFLSYMFILSFHGLQNISCNLIKKYDKEKFKLIFKITVIVTIFMLIALFLPFARTRNYYNDYSINVTNTGGSYYIDTINENKDIIKQDFKVKKKFNKILVRSNKISDDEDIYYTINVYKEDDIIESFNINSNDVKNDYITLKLDTNSIEANKNYSLEIKRNKDNKKSEDTIGFSAINYRVIKTYDGNFYLNDEISKSNLFIKVYNKKKSTYFSKLGYILFSSFILFVEITIYYIIVKMMNKKNDIIKSQDKKMNRRVYKTKKN